MGFLRRWLLLLLVAVRRPQENAYSIGSAEAHKADVYQDYAEYSTGYYTENNLTSTGPLNGDYQEHSTGDYTDHSTGHTGPLHDGANYEYDVTGSYDYKDGAEMGKQNVYVPDLEEYQQNEKLHYANYGSQQQPAVATDDQPRASQPRICQPRHQQGSQQQSHQQSTCPQKQSQPSPQPAGPSGKVPCPLCPPGKVRCPSCPPGKLPCRPKKILAQRVGCFPKHPGSSSQSPAFQTGCQPREMPAPKQPTAVTQKLGSPIQVSIHRPMQTWRPFCPPKPPGTGPQDPAQQRSCHPSPIQPSVPTQQPAATTQRPGVVAKLPLCPPEYPGSSSQVSAFQMGCQPREMPAPTQAATQEQSAPIQMSTHRPMQTWRPFCPPKPPGTGPQDPAQRGCHPSPIQPSVPTQQPAATTQRPGVVAKLPLCPPEYPGSSSQVSAFQMGCQPREMPAPTQAATQEQSAPIQMSTHRPMQTWRPFCPPKPPGTGPQDPAQRGCHPSPIQPSVPTQQPAATTQRPGVVAKLPLCPPEYPGRSSQVSAFETGCQPREMPAPTQAATQEQSAPIQMSTHRPMQTWRPFCPPKPPGTGPHDPAQQKGCQPRKKTSAPVQQPIVLTNMSGSVTQQPVEQRPGSKFQQPLCPPSQPGTGPQMPTEVKGCRPSKTQGPSLQPRPPTRQPTTPMQVPTQMPEVSQAQPEPPNGPYQATGKLTHTQQPDYPVTMTQQHGEPAKQPSYLPQILPWTLQAGYPPVYQWPTHHKPRMLPHLKFRHRGYKTRMLPRVQAKPGYLQMSPYRQLQPPVTHFKR
ncbi:uncharacterized protein KZ484_016898 [Pholidichthys leucotaenia]